jgi:hypothetical protein
MEPPFDRVDEDLGGGSSSSRLQFFIGGQDVVEEYLVSGMYPLSASISFKRVADGVTSISRLKLPLPKFHVGRRDDEDDV